MEIGTLKILNVWWFSQINTKSIIGIVQSKDMITFEIINYVGIIEYPKNINEDIKFIVNYGSKLNKAQLLDIYYD